MGDKKRKLQAIGILLMDKQSDFTLTATGGGGLLAPPSYLLQIAPKLFMTGYCHFFTFPHMIFEGYFWYKNNQNIFISKIAY